MELAEEELEVWGKLCDDLDDVKTAYPPKAKSAKRKRPTSTSSSRKKCRVDDSDDDFIDDNNSEGYAGTNDDDSKKELSDEDESRDSLTEDNITAKIKELKAVKKNVRQEWAKLEETIKDVKK